MSRLRALYHALTSHQSEEFQVVRNLLLLQESRLTELERKQQVRDTFRRVTGDRQ